MVPQIAQIDLAEMLFRPRARRGLMNRGDIQVCCSSSFHWSSNSPYQFRAKIWVMTRFQPTCGGDQTPRRVSDD
jgi:hypothetical protein